MRMPVRPSYGLWLTLALVVGCQGGAPGQPGPLPGLTLERVDGPQEGRGSVVVATSTRNTAAQVANTTARQADREVPIQQPAGVPIGGPVYSGGGASGGGGNPAGARTGTLTIDLHSFIAAFARPAHRRLLETVQDIATIEITVHQNGVPDHTATLTQADIAQDAVSYTFNGLPLGNGIVTVVAYDAQGNPIGSASQVVKISDTQTAVADMTVQLVASSASPGPGGTLSTHVRFVPAPTPTPPGTVLATYTTNMPVALEPGTGGKLFVHTRTNVGGSSLGYWQAKTQVIDASGQVGTFEDFHYTAGSSTYALARDPASDRLWASTNEGVYLLDSAGTRQAFASVRITSGSWDGIGLKLGPGGTALAVSQEKVKRIATDGTVVDTGAAAAFDVATDSLGNFWTNWRPTPSDPLSASVRKYSAAGTLLGEYPLPFAPVQLAVDAADNVWAVGGPRNHSQPGGPVAKISALGSVVATANIQARAIAFDAGGRVWAAGPQLVELDANAATIATFPVECHVVTVDPDGFVWVGSYTIAEGSRVKKIMP
jgi:hypothetical protein